MPTTDQTPRGDTTPPTRPDPDAEPVSTYRAGPHWFALIATGFTWPLLLVGGLVTTFRVGMAVPDWPTTFGMNMFLYDMTRAPWGVFGEHAHRLYGAAVGIFTILLMLDFLIFSRRRWIKVMGVVALVAVIGQGLLGGLRVTRNSTLLAAVHGTTAQLFFALMVALCVWTSRSWVERTRTVEAVGRIRRMSLALLGLVSVQVLVGAWLRHYSRGDALWVHSALAVLVFGHGVGTVAAVLRRPVAWPELVPAGRALLGTLVVQVTLGVLAWWMLRPFNGTIPPNTFYPTLVRTGHQANASLLIGSVVVLTLRSIQLTSFGPARSVQATPERALEAVA